MGPSPDVRGDSTVILRRSLLRSALRSEIALRESPSRVEGLVGCVSSDLGVRGRNLSPTTRSRPRTGGCLWSGERTRPGAVTQVTTQNGTTEGAYSVYQTLDSYLRRRVRVGTDETGRDLPTTLKGSVLSESNESFSPLLPSFSSLLERDTPTRLPRNGRTTRRRRVRPHSHPVTPPSPDYPSPSGPRCDSTPTLGVRSLTSTPGRCTVIPRSLLSRKKGRLHVTTGVR